MDVLSACRRACLQTADSKFDQNNRVPVISGICLCEWKTSQDWRPERSQKRWGFHPETLRAARQFDPDDARAWAVEALSTECKKPADLLFF